MIYNSFNFIIVFPFIFLLYYVIPGKFEKARNGFLLVTSYLLYLNWKPVYALILFGVTLITFYGAKLLEKSSNHRKLVLNVSVFLQSFLCCSLSISILQMKLFFRSFHFWECDLILLALIGLFLLEYHSLLFKPWGICGTFIIEK